MLGKYLVLGVALAAFPLNAAAAADCSCVVSGNVTVSNVSGDVRVTGEEGFASAVPGTVLGVGSRLSTGASSNAELSGAGCDLSVASDTDVDILPADGKGICLATASVTNVPQLNKQAAYGQTLNGAPVPLLVIGGAVIVGGIVAAAALSDDNDASD
ncbi:hypothetical protein B7H23_14690 [Notoacmeibacter marinus]|uniref:Uncharacterized protein n=1 Tax=Notoacmeibacter marinus TaxID=1876515 RepID=A0A231UTZ0_9HYPH|nr:hypothetical protein [Notoacmeibacter marinus]OXS99404.1 hypothetical protein B7H23_14690 [Notoacmeibacter marinus]